MCNFTKYLRVLGYAFLVPNALAAETLTLEAALERVLARHPLRVIQQYEIEMARGDRQSASRWPNPDLDYRREDLTNNGLETGEWTAGIGMSLSGLWTRGSRIEAADVQLRIASLNTIETRNALRQSVQEAFARTYFAGQRQRIWRAVSGLLVEATRIGRERLAEGDISHYEHQRLALEARQYHQRETLASARWTLERQRLALLLDPESGQLPDDLAPFEPDTSLTFALSSLQKQALEKRPDLLIARAELSARQAERSTAHRELWPEPRMFLGLKEQSDEYRGLAAEIALELPVFDRQQGERRRARAATRQQQLRVAWKEQQALQQVAQTHARYVLYHDQMRDIGRDSGPERMLEMARHA